MEYKAAQSDWSWMKLQPPTLTPCHWLTTLFPRHGLWSTCVMLCSWPDPTRNTPSCTLRAEPQQPPAQPSPPSYTTQTICHSTHTPPSLMVHWKTINITNHRICSEPYTDSHLYICHLLQDTRNKASSTAKTF